MKPVTIPGTLITVALETVTPALARKWLDTLNRKNRRKRQGLINQICRDIESEAWKLTHQGIAFADDGSILDGQHRLEGIAKAGVAVQVLVFRNVPTLQKCGRQTIEAIDGGAVRSLGDQLHLAHGVANASKVASLLSNIARGLACLKEPPTVDQVVKLLGVYPDLPAIGALRWKKGVAVKSFTSSAVCAAAVVAHHFNPSLRFYGGFLFGMGLKEGDGALTLRNVLMGESLRQESLFKATCNAIRAEIEGKPWMKYDDDPAGREFFREADPPRWKKVRSIFRIPTE